MAAEEAVVRARIAALKSLLDTQDRQSATSMSYGHARYNNAPHPRHVRHTSRAPVRRNPSFPTPHSKPRHLTWTPPDESSSSSSSSSTTHLSSLAPSLSTAMTTTNPPKRPASVTTLALEDGMYRKMGRGFKLRREDTLPKSAVEVSAAIATTKQKQPSPSPPPPPAPVVISSMPPPLPPPSTLTRRPTPLHRGSSAPVPHPRTELCLFYIKHGECKHKHACLFVHDSRTISMCRSFLRGACLHASACRLSHTPDQHKMPDCAMFLKGLCSREGCMYRHVNVSRQAATCDAFSLRGYCADGATCQHKHEFAKGTSSSRILYRQGGQTSVAYGHMLHVLNDDSMGNDPTPPVEGSLNLRPTIRFTPKVV